ncbi:MAG TPA: glycosyltransferase 87 family protein [Dongiaceae bacterium]|nr:glycosyltransferase 87 family protein [Dongiaceae bacterium]
MLAENRDLRRTVAAGDFPAFYCGAVVARERLDPYRAAPLEACERARTVAPGTTPLPNGIAPAPLPGYVLALVVPLSLLPFGIAACIWYALLIAAVAATVEMLRALTGLPRAALAAAALGSEIVASVTYGQLAPLATLGVAAAALALRRERSRRAALWCALVLLQPQVAPGPLAALLLWRPRARIVVAGVCALLGLISLVTLGVAANVEYARSVVGAQALAEAPFDIQLSLTWLLVFFGSGESAALHVAWFEYVVLLVGGVLLAGALANRLGLREALVVVPAAAAVLGGTYLHVFQLAVALPCALVLAARVPAARAYAWIAVALLAVPWEATGSRLILALSAAAVATIAWTALHGVTVRVRVLAACAAVAFVALEPVAAARVPNAIVRPAPATAAFLATGVDPALASGAHGVAPRARPRRVEASWRTFAQKTPEWAGLAALFAALAAAAVAARRRRPALSASRA